MANASVAGGFVHSDLPKCGIAVAATARGGDGAAAREAALDWRGGPDEAGAAGTVLGVFVDPALAAEAHALGEGARFEAVFNRVESGFSKRLAAPARVLALRDGYGVGRRGTMAGRAFDLGPSALLELEGPGGLRDVVGSLRRQCHEPRMLEMHGVDIAAARCVVVKSRGPFRAGFDEFFPDERIFEVDAPGLTSPVLANFARRRLPRPVFPLDPDAAWREPGWA